MLSDQLLRKEKAEAADAAAQAAAAARAAESAVQSRQMGAKQLNAFICMAFYFAFELVLVNLYKYKVFKISRG